MRKTKSRGNLRRRPALPQIFSQHAESAVGACHERSRKGYTGASNDGLGSDQNSIDPMFASLSSQILADHARFEPFVRARSVSRASMTRFYIVLLVDSVL